MMSFKCSAVVVATIFTASFTNGNVVSKIATTAGGCDSSSHAYDYGLMVMQWPGAHHQSETSYFTNHGLWPSREGSDSNTYPCTCTTEQFDQSQISSIMTDMNKYWPSYEGVNAGFWAHEWGKHGTCTGLSQLKFFSTALAARASYDPIQAFTKANVRPGQSYDLSFLNNAFSSTFEFLPLLGCSSANALEEVAFCLDKTTNKIKNCSSNVRSDQGEFNNCDAGSPILIPNSTGPSPSPPPPGPPSPPGTTCEPNEHGPACTSDADCKKIANCVRCAASGYCTESPAAEEKLFFATF